jgi:hypothetical protein
MMGRRSKMVDDEPLARTNLLVLLRRDAEIEIVGECGFNLDRVRELQLGASGEYEVALLDGTRLRLSRSYRDQLQSRLRLKQS